MSKERRKADRIPHRTQILFQVGDKTLEGIILNFSEIGILVQTDHCQPQKTHVQIPFQISPDEIETLHGEVVWFREGVRTASGKWYQGQMGIELAAAPRRYLMAVHTTRQERKDRTPRSQDERFEVYHPVTVHVDGQSFVEYTENLSRGGIYLITNREFPINTHLAITIQLPGLEETIHVEGHVKFVLPRYEAQAFGKAPGCGIQFNKVEEASQRLIDQYILRLGVHRSNPERYRTKQVPSKGSLEMYLVPELLIHFHNQRSNGALIIKSQGVTKTFHFRNGRLIYAESSMASESFGRFLSRRGLLKLGQMEKWLPLLEAGDVLLARKLLEKKILDEKRLVDAILDNQSERITQSFAWFFGSYEFVKTSSKQTENIPVFPLNIHEVIFHGIQRWYPGNMLRSWTGISMYTVLKKQIQITAAQSIHPNAQRVLRALWAPKTFAALKEETNFDEETLYQVVYSLLISEWVDFDFSFQEESTAPKLQEKTLTKSAGEWVKLVDGFHDRMSSLDFFEILSVENDASRMDIEKAYRDILQKFANWQDEVDDAETIRGINTILGWVQTAYETLTDADMRLQYEKQQVAEDAELPGGTALSADVFEVEQAILVAMALEKEGEFKEAIQHLKPHVAQNRDHPMLLAWYGWLFYHFKAQEPRKESIKLLERSIELDPLDPQAHYFLGIIYQKLGNEERAQQAFKYALKLEPNFLEAKRALAA